MDGMCEQHTDSQNTVEVMVLCTHCGTGVATELNTGRKVVRRERHKQRGTTYAGIRATELISIFLRVAGR